MDLIKLIRNIFFKDIVGEVNLYFIISTLFKFVFVFVVLYFIYLIVKLIIIDINRIDYKLKRKVHYIYIIDSADNKKKYILEKENKIGRSIYNDIILDSEIISNEHAVIYKVGDDYYIKDCNSLNGTYLNEEYVQEELKLINKDIIEIGEYRLVYIEKIVEHNEGNYDEID